jgi:hypothetical protein
VFFHSLIQSTGHVVVPILDVAVSQEAPPFNAGWVILEDCNKYPDGSQVGVSVHSLTQGTGHLVVPILEVAVSQEAPPFIAGWVILEDCNKYPDGSQVFVSVHSLTHGIAEVFIFLFFINAIEIDIINIASIIIPSIIYIIYLFIYN